MKEAKEVIDAWESLQGNQNYSPSAIDRWLNEDMKPVMDKLRNKLKYGIQTKKK